MRIPSVSSLYQSHAAAVTGSAVGFQAILAQTVEEQDAAQADTAAIETATAQPTGGKTAATAEATAATQEQENVSLGLTALSAEDLAVLTRLQQAMNVPNPSTVAQAALPDDTSLPATAVHSTGEQGEAVTDYALQFLGTPYVWGGEDLEKGADCSGFTQSVFKEFGVDLSRTAYRQSKQGVAVDVEDLQPGDLLCFKTADYAPVTHAAIYLGDGKFVHASSSKGKVTVSTLNSWWKDHLVTARRVL